MRVRRKIVVVGQRGEVNFVLRMHRAAHVELHAAESFAELRAIVRSVPELMAGVVDMRDDRQLATAAAEELGRTRVPVLLLAGRFDDAAGIATQRVVRETDAANFTGEMLDALLPMLARKRGPKKQGPSLNDLRLSNLALRAAEAGLAKGA